MSEFKFACPVCGQHITADSSAAGSQLDCPTCFRKIVIPQASASSGSKFVLSASEVTQRRPQAYEPSGSALPPPMRRPSILIILMAVLFILAAGISLLKFRGGLFPGKSGPADRSPDVRNTSADPVEWKLDLATAVYPAESVSGKLRGLDFVCDRTILQGGTLSLRMGKESPADLGISIYLYARQAADLSGKSALITTNNIRSPKVVVRWKDETGLHTETFTNGYALKLELGNLDGDELPGKLYLCLPDESRSRVAGVFHAKIRKPTPPKPK